MPLHQIITDITKDGVLYAVVLTEASAADKTINIHVLQGKNPKGWFDDIIIWVLCPTFRARILKVGLMISLFGSCVLPSGQES